VLSLSCFRGAVGVGNSVLHDECFTIDSASLFADPVCVATNDEHPVSPVPGTDTASWNKERPDGVTFTFQVRQASVECHPDDPSNILSNNPSGPEL